MAEPKRAKTSPRSVRVKAAELATQCFHGGVEQGDAGRLLSLCIFFEMYILNGATITEREMKLMSRRKVKNLRVIAGGRL